MHSLDVHVRYHHERLQAEARRDQLVQLARAGAATVASPVDQRSPRRWQALLQGRWAWDLAADPAARPDSSR